MTYVDSFGIQRTHLLHEESVSECQRVSTIEACKNLGAECVHRVIDSLNAFFSDLPIFSTIRLAIPKHYPLDEIKRNQLTKQLFDILLVRFDWNNDIVDQCKE